MNGAVERQVWRRGPDVAHVSTAERVALLDLRHLERPPYLLQGSAAVVWDLLDGCSLMLDVVRSVAQHYGVAEVEVEQSVYLFVDQLSDLGLAEPVAS
jgi:hypothetical protein